MHAERNHYLAAKNVIVDWYFGIELIAGDVPNQVIRADATFAPSSGHATFTVARAFS